MVEERTVGGVRLAVVVGMNRVCIVRGYHEACGYPAHQVFLTPSKRHVDAPEGIFQKCTRCALFGAASHLFIVQDAVDGNAA